MELHLEYPRRRITECELGEGECSARAWQIISDNRKSVWWFFFRGLEFDPGLQFANRAQVLKPGFLCLPGSSLPLIPAVWS